MAVLRADIAASSDADTVAAATVATAATSSAERKRREALLRGGDDDASADPPGLSELEVERERVLRSAAKLEESNAELKAAIARGEDDGADDHGELRAAFGENIVIIAKHRARAAALEEEVRRAKGVRGSGASVAVEPQWLARPESGSGNAPAAPAAAAAAAPPPPPAAQPASDEAAAPTTTEGAGDVWL